MHTVQYENILSSPANCFFFDLFYFSAVEYTHTHTRLHCYDPIPSQQIIFVQEIVWIGRRETGKKKHAACSTPSTKQNPVIAVKRNDAFRFGPDFKAVESTLKYGSNSKLYLCSNRWYYCAWVRICNTTPHIHTTNFSGEEKMLLVDS